MQILTALEWALAALTGLCLVLCALITVDSRPMKSFRTATASHS